MDKKLVSMDVVDGSAPNNLSIIPCSGIISQEQIKRAAFPLESDLVVVRPIVGDVRGKVYVLFWGTEMNSVSLYCDYIFCVIQ